MLIIAERINASRKLIAEAISSKNAAVIQAEAKAQNVPKTRKAAITTSRTVFRSAMCSPPSLCPGGTTS